MNNNLPVRTFSFSNHGFQISFVSFSVFASGHGITQVQHDEGWLIILLGEGPFCLQKAPVSQGGGSARQTQSYIVASALSLFRYCGTHFPFQLICNLWTCSRPIMCSSEGRPPAPTLKQIYRRCSKWLAATCACASAHGEGST